MRGNSAISERADELRHLRFQGVSTLVRRHRPVAPDHKQSAKPPLRHTHSEPGQIDAFILWLLNRAGLHAGRYRANPLQRRLAACLRALHCTTTSQAKSLIESKPALLEGAVDALLLGVTEFYRDPQVFAALGQEMAKLKGKRSGIRVWSAACSDGCELYSVAMLMDELGLLKGSELLGTDCRSQAVAHARNALYHPNHLHGVQPSLLDRYFHKEENGYRVVSKLRGHATFEVHDLFRAHPKQASDVILWRNTAIYLTKAAAHDLWTRLAESLAPGGLLVTGRAERPDCAVPLKRIAGCIYAKVVDRE